MRNRPTKLPGSSRLRRVSETIAWCGTQVLEADPYESDEIRRRRKLGDEAGKLIVELYRKHQDQYSKAPEYEKVERLSKEADPGSIVPPLRNQLRTAGWKPLADIASLIPHTRRAEIVEELAAKRADHLGQLKATAVSDEPKMAEERILIYYPDQNLADGAAEYHSKGFFDANNVPPWDTWVCYHDDALIAWVPTILEKLATIGIDANVEGCISWATPEFLKAVFD